MNQERIKSTVFTMTSLDMVYLSEGPLPGEIKLRCSDPLLREYMRLDSVLCGPVYIVTGIKIAKYFKLDGEKSVSKEFEGEVGEEINPETSIGAGVGVLKKNRIADEFEADGDVVFAY